MKNFISTFALLGFAVSIYAAPIANPDSTSSSVVVDSHKSYNEDGYLDYSETCKNGNCVYDADKNDNSQKDSTLDAEEHEWKGKRSNGFDFDVHTQKQDQTDFDFSKWNKTRAGSDNSTGDYHTFSFDDKSVHGDGQDKNGKKVLSFNMDKQHYDEKNLDFSNESRGNQRPPLPASNGPRTGLDSIRAKLGSFKRAIIRRSKDLYFHDDQHAEDHSSTNLQGYDFGPHPPKGEKPYSNGLDVSTDSQHEDEEHMQLESQSDDDGEARYDDGEAHYDDPSAPYADDDGYTDDEGSPYDDGDAYPDDGSDYSGKGDSGYEHKRGQTFNLDYDEQNSAEEHTQFDDMQSSNQKHTEFHSDHSADGEQSSHVETSKTPDHEEDWE